MRLLGRQNLILYKDQKFNLQQVEAEFQFNKSLGMSLNAWKSGTLVYDDDGKVEEALLSNLNKKQKIK
jgi:hypothetical protein